MIVDASAVQAVLLKEPEAEEFMRAFSSEHEMHISPTNYLEACVRLMKTGKDPDRVDRFMEASAIHLAETMPEQARRAREAYATFGKGNHPAKLNIGDCFAYALSKARDEPLLFKGNDFSQTDMKAAL